MAGSEHRSVYCFKEWMRLQAQDLDELLQALAQNTDNNKSEHVFPQLVEKSITHFQDYMDKRSNIYHGDASAYLGPRWCTSLENSSLWIGGCRPTSFIRLIYALVGLEVKSLIAELTQSSTSRNHVGQLSAIQLSMINNLHMKTVKEEDKMTSRLASLQEDITDQPISIVAKGSRQVGEPNGEVEHALDKHDASMADIIEEADKLRLRTLKELMNILTPVQAVDFLAASKKLHLCIHEWGKKRDHKHGRN
ncbi:TGA transcription factor [Melia azedarach]|uniref:TGA transcription factor n=1 Tax=Melia azedarach TaxID=155640 RepID=A0ACC1WXD9_MELAZ|nr:TGA transcription factor [Melia azedarach]